MDTKNFNFFTRLFRKPAFTPPKNVLDAFTLLFPEVINIEWSLAKELYEVIFYKDQVENIAVFNQSASLIMHKMFLSEEYLPEPIKEILTHKGEIMNVVMINHGNLLTYEIIFRDTQLNRYVVTFDILGNMVEQHAL